MMLAMTRNSNGRQKFERDYHANTKALRRARAKAKLTLKGLQKKSGIDYTTISRIENGHNRSPHWPTLEQIADALDVEVDEIVIYDAPDDLPGEAGATPTDPPPKPGPTAENKEYTDEIRQERKELLAKPGERENSHGSSAGDRAP